MAGQQVPVTIGIHLRKVQGEGLNDQEKLSRKQTWNEKIVNL